MRDGELAERLSLRGYDSVRLAAAESLRFGDGAEFLCFASFDDHLNHAAADLGLQLLTAAARQRVSSAAEAPRASYPSG